jgi:hypothetical protein
LAPRPKKKKKNDTYQLGRPIYNLGANVVAIKYCCFDEIHNERLK